MGVSAKERKTVSKRATRRNLPPEPVPEITIPEVVPDPIYPQIDINTPTENCIEVALNYTPHSLGQQEFHDSPARYRVLASGRQWGKTECAAGESCIQALSGKDRWIMVVAPIYKLSQILWERHLKILPKIVIKQVRLEDRRIELINGSRIDFLSADTQWADTALRGGTLWMVVFEEAARIQDVAYNAIWPALSIHRGKVVAITTPKGQAGWLWDMAKKARQRVPDHAIWSFESIDNPNFPIEVWEEAKEKFPQSYFDQEFRGLFLPGGGQVFHGVEKIINPKLNDGLPPDPEMTYFAGHDLAKKRDFSWSFVLDGRGRVVYNRRWQHETWPETAVSVAQVQNRFDRCYGLMDSTGQGDPVFDLIQELDSPPLIDPFHFTQDSKEDLIVGLQAAIEKQWIQIPDDPELIEELHSYGAEELESGRMKYGAPQHKHDDGVIGLALAVKCWRGFNKGRIAISWIEEENENVPEPEQVRYREPDKPELAGAISGTQRQSLFENESIWTEW